MNYFIDVTLSVVSDLTPPAYGRLAVTFVLTDENGVSTPSGFDPVDSELAADRAALASVIVQAIVNQWNGGSPPQPIDMAVDNIYVLWGAAEVTGPYRLVAAI